MSTLYDQLDRFAERHGLSEARLGELVVQDRRFMSQLRAGMIPPGNVQSRVKDWMLDNYGREFDPPSAAFGFVRSTASCSQPAVISTDMHLRGERQMLVDGSAALRDAVLRELSQIAWRHRDGART